MLINPVKRAILPRKLLDEVSCSIPAEKKKAVVISFVSGPNFESGMKAAFSKIALELSEKGLSIHDVDFAMVTLRSMADFAAFNAPYEAELLGHKPARYCVEKADILPAGSLAMIKVKASEGAKVPVTPENFPAPVGPFSYGICSDGKVYVSGQIMPKEPDFGKQVTAVIGKVETVLKAGGSSLAEVTEATFFYVDEAKFMGAQVQLQKAFPAWHSQHNDFKKVSALPLGVDFEISCVSEKRI